MTTMTLTLGDRMRVARQHAGLTQVAIAERLGIGRNTISAYELDRSTPARVILLGWAHETGADLRWLCGQEVAA